MSDAATAEKSPDGDLPSVSAAPYAGASIPIYRWRQMRHGQFWGGMKNQFWGE